MPAYPRARQGYTVPAPNPSLNNRNANDRSQPFREPISTTGPSRSKRVSADHNPSPVTPAVTGIAYPTQEEDDLEFDETAHNTSNNTGQRHPIAIDQTTTSRGGSSNSRSNHHHPHVATSRNNHSMHAHQPIFHTNGNKANSSQDDTSSDNLGGMAAPAGETALDHLWDTIREKKARKMAKERPKVESLEEITGELAHSEYPLYPTRERQHPAGLAHTFQQPSAIQALDNLETISVAMPIVQDHMHQMHESPSKQVKKRKSLVSFRESKDGRSMNATIELPPEVKKQDIHISFNARRLVVSWMIIDITEGEDDDGRIILERVEQIFQRTLPLGEGTKYEEIKSYMIKNRLTIRYPNMRCIRVEPKHTDDA
ncbi:hypothetical protein JOM56_013835 [Amanita muscaria]